MFKNMSSRYGTDNKVDSSENQRRGMRVIIFAVMGVLKLWLWKEGIANQYALYLGLALIFSAIISGLEFFKIRKNI
ncbi:MAG: hypothetical protein Q9M50_03815 [Methylococcales bacterium]|nr:hypothetical protein [Methylococcales bacterium]